MTRLEQVYQATKPFLSTDTTAADFESWIIGAFCPNGKEPCLNATEPGACKQCWETDI